MANPVDPAQTSPPSTSPSPAPATQQSTDMSSQQPPSQPPQPSNGASKPAKPPKQPKSKDAPPAAGGAPGEEKLSPAELKKKAKAEKAARRAKERAEREASGGAGAGPGPNAAPPKKGSTGGGAGGKEAPGQPYKSQRHRRGSATQASATEQKKKQEDKNVAVFGHLYGQPRRTTIAGAGKEVHPAVLALGLQMRDYVVCGSSARCVATLLAFKRVCIGVLCLVARCFMLIFCLGHRGLYDPPGYLPFASLDYPPIPSDYLSLYMPSSLHQSG